MFILTSSFRVRNKLLLIPNITFHKKSKSSIMNAVRAKSTTFKAIKSGNWEIMTSSDENIILEYKVTKNKRILAPLFKKYNEKLFGVAFYYLHERESAMDAVMEAYEVVFKTIDTKDITYYKGWLMSICKNICLKKIRDEKKFSELKDNSDISVENEDEAVYSNETIEKILEFIPRLKENQRVCIEDFYLKGKSYDDISTSYEMTFKEVKSYIQNGKRNLKVMFEKDSKST